MCFFFGYTRRYNKAEMGNCIFCDFASSVEPERRVCEYVHWRLVLQLPEKLRATKQAAGLLIARRHFSQLSDASDAEILELRDIIKDAAERLCKHVGVMYTHRETVGINQGVEAGQTIFHTHMHVLPVAIEDPPELKVRAGIGGAFEALRRERLQ
jgi:histidine triad (HIT) family protein